MVGASAKCTFADIMSVLEGGGDSDSNEGGDGSRRRLNDMGGMFDGVPEDCRPCVTKCITDALMNGDMATETDGVPDYYLCLFECPESEYEAPCSIGDAITIQQQQEEMFSNLATPGAGGEQSLEEYFKDPFGSVDGLPKQCRDCQSKCAETTLLPALEALGNALEDAFSGGDGSGAEALDFESQMTQFSFCSSCCMGMDMAATIMPENPTASCKTEFKDVIPQMFQGSSGGSSGGSNAGMIVGIIVAVLVVIGLATGVFCYYKKKSVPEPEGPSTPMNTTAEGEKPPVAEV